MRIGILGSGLMGAKLGTIFARAGHEVTFSYARSSDKLARLAREAGPGARSGTPAEAVHWNRVSDVLRQVGALTGRTIVTCSLPMSDDDTGLVVAHTSSGAEELARMVPGATVVSAFGSIPSEVLFGVFAARGRGTPPSMLYCGDDERAKEVAVQLIRDAGFEPVDAGALRAARYIEPFTMLVAVLAYEGAGGPELAYRFEHVRT